MSLDQSFCDARRVNRRIIALPKHSGGDPGAFDEKLKPRRRQG
jgi:hypothetical protein